MAHGSNASTGDSHQASGEAEVRRAVTRLEAAADGGSVTGPGATPATDGDSEGLAEGIAKVVERLNSMPEHGGRIDFALNLGQIVMDFFGGDPKKLSARGSKDVSVREIAQHPDCPFSARELRVGAKLHILGGQLPDRDVLKSEHLTYSHLELVVGAPKESWLELVSEAAARRVRLDDLRSRISAAREGRRRGGPKPMSAFERRLASVERAVDKLVDYVRDPDPQSSVDHVVLAEFIERVKGRLAVAELRGVVGNTSSE